MQNIYDNPEFFRGYAKLRQNEQGFNTLLEQPAIRSLLSSLTGISVIDLGCGFGDFCRYVATAGAKTVLGIDPSEKMLAVAQEQTTESIIQYKCTSIENFVAPASNADLVVSSLALHYVADYHAAIRKIYSWIKTGGQFIFSVEHPICTANPNVVMFESQDGSPCFPVMNYRDEGLFYQSWFVDNVMKYHRTMQTYVNGLLEAGFTVQKFLEPMPTDAMIEEKPDFAVHKIRPPVLIISAIKQP